MNHSKPSLLFCLPVLLSFYCVDIECVSGQDWPQYRGPNATGKLQTESASLDMGTGKLTVHWKVEAPLGFSSISIVGDKAVTLVSRNDKEVCVALDVESGRELWATEFGTSDYKQKGGNAGAQGNKGGDGPRSTPAINDNRVFVYDAHLGLHCLNLADGKIVWKHDIEKEFDGEIIKWNNASSPLIDSDHVYVSGGGEGQSFMAFDQTTGDLKWKSGNEKMTHASPAFAKMDNRKLIVYFMQFGLVAVDAETGKEAWRSRFPFDVSSAASPIVNGAKVYCSAGYGVGAGMYDVSDSTNIKEMWRKPNRLMNHWSSPVLHDGHLFGLYRFKRYGSAPLRCVDFETGEIKWSQDGFGQGNCIIAAGKLIVLSDYGELVIAEPDTMNYKELWRGKVVDGKCWSTPAFANGKIFIRSTKEAVCISFE